MTLIVANRYRIALGLAAEHGLESSKWIWVAPDSKAGYIKLCARLGITFDRELTKIGQVFIDTKITTDQVAS